MAFVARMMGRSLTAKTVQRLAAPSSILRKYFIYLSTSCVFVHFSYLLEGLKNAS